MNFEEKIEQLRKDKQYDNKTFVKFSVMLVFILICLFIRGHSVEINCPYCENSFEMRLELEPYEMRECPGAGWYCDNCGMFQSQGQKCVYCKAKRK